MSPVFSVSQFLAQINGIITGQFVVEGEVSQYKISSGKWIFFDLKDETGCLNCFSTVFMIRQPLEDGMKIRVSGYPKVYEKTGRFSFTAQSVELVGEGTLERAYQLLKIKLRSEGLFAVERKRPIPQFPARIGIIASGDSAAWGDFTRIVNNRWGGVELILRHVAVQGEGAVRDIVQAFQEFNENATLCDVLVLIRGGGSREDLAAFNTEEVARAVYTSRIPVVSGVGHERDESLVDFVVDRRASTPSNAAEMVVPERRDFLNGLASDLERAFQVMEHAVYAAKQEINHSTVTLVRSLDMQVKNVEARIHNAEVLFRNMDPVHVLRRGYSITRTKKRAVVRRASQVDSGESVVIELADGNLAGIIQ